MATSVVVLPPDFGFGSGGGSGPGSPGDNTFTSPIFEILGSAGSPSYSFTSHQDRGMFSGASFLGFAVGGQTQMQLFSNQPAAFARGASLAGPLTLSSGAIVLNGSLASPEGQAVAPVGSLYLSSNGGPNSTVFYKETGTDFFGWRAVKSLDASFPTYAPAAGPGAPSYAFVDAQGQPTDRGLYAQPGGEIGIARGGVALLRILADNSVRMGALATSSIVADGQISADTLTVLDDASFGGDVGVAGETSLDGPLVANQASFAQDVTLAQRLSLPGGPQLTAGSTSPEGSVAAPPGSLYLHALGGTTSLFTKASGTGSTGWAALLNATGLPYPFQAPSSSVSAPSYSFEDDGGAGMGFASGVLTLGTAGAARLQLLANGQVRVTGPLRALSDAQIDGQLAALGATFAGGVAIQQGFSVDGAASFGDRLNLPAGASLLSGALATPSGSITASPGSLYLSSVGGVGSTLFVKEQGTGVTGWTALSASSGGGGPGSPSPLAFPILAPYGSAAAPSYGFAGGQQGMSASDDGSLFLSTGGMGRLVVDADGSLSVAASASVGGAVHLLSTLLVDGNTALSGTLNIQSGTTGTSANFSSFVNVGTRLTLSSTASVSAGSLATPEGVVDAIAGSLYLSVSGGPGRTLFVKEEDLAGMPTNTGWVAQSPSGEPGPPGEVVFPLFAPTGSPAAPSYSFDGPNGADSGLYGLTTGAVGIGASGLSALEARPDGSLVLRGTVSVQDGSFASSVESQFSNVVAFQDSTTFAGPATFNGGINLPGALSAGSLSVSGGSMLGGQVTVGGGLSVAGASSFASISATGAATLLSLSAQATSVTTLAASGLASLAAGASIGGALILSGGLASPNGQVSAAQGSLYLSQTGGSNSTLWVRQSGSDTSWSFFGAPGQASFPLRSNLAGSASSVAYGFLADSGGSGMFAPSTGALALASGGSASLVLGSDQSASFSSAVSIGGNLTLGNAQSMLMVQSASQFVGATEFVGSAIFNQGVGFPGNGKVFGGSFENPNGFVTASPGSLYLSSTGGVDKVLWVKESGATSNMGWVSYGNPAVTTPAYPLRAPTGTTAAPNIPYSFEGNTTTGFGYDATASAVALYTSNQPSMQAVGKSCGFGGFVPVADPTQGVQLNALSNSAAYTSFYSAGSLAFLLGYNSFSGGVNFPLGPWVRAFKPGDPIWFTTTPATQNVVAYAMKINASGNVTIGASTDALSSLGVGGSKGVAIGSGVYASTAAPTNGLLVQGASIFQGNVTFQGSVAGLGSTPRTIIPLATGTNTTITPAQTGSVITLPGNGTVILPTATVGLEYRLINTATAAIQFAAQPADTITSNGVRSASGAVLLFSGLGAFATLTCVANGSWYLTPSNLAAVSYPLLAPTGTTAAPNIPYSFTGATTSGWGFDTTRSALSAYIGNVNPARFTASGLGIGGASPSATNVFALVSAAAFAGVNVGCPTIQMQSPANVAAVASFVDSAGVYTSSFGYNDYTLDGLPKGTIISALASKPMIFTVGPNSATVAGVCYPVSTTPFWSFGSKVQSLSTVGVFGNLAVGTGIASSTAAPANGLLVQGPAIFQGTATFQNGVAGAGSPGATLSGTSTLTSATSDTTYFVPGTNVATVTLPSVAVGAYCEFSFVVAPGAILTLRPPTGGTITLEGTTSATNGSAVSSGACAANIVCFPGTGNWQNKNGIAGAWTVA